MSHNLPDIRTLILDRNWPEVIAVADRLAEEGRIQQARALLLEAVDGGSGEAAHNLALDAESAGDSDGARSYYEKAVAHGYQPALLNLGLLLESMGDLEGARRAYEIGVEHADTKAMVNLGLLLIDVGEFASAVEVLTAAARSDDRYAWQLGDAHRAAGDQHAAMAAYRRAIDSGEARAARDLAGLVDPGREVEVLQLFAVAEASGARGAAAELAEYLVARGRLDDAETVCKRALAADDSYAPLVYARLLAMTGRIEQAREYYEVARSNGDDVAQELEDLSAAEQGA